LVAERLIAFFATAPNLGRARAAIHKDNFEAKDIRHVSR
jgi:hypothetical protein